MEIRYPEGFRSIIGADLQLVGDYQSPLLKGTISVHDAVWSRRFEPTVDLFSFGGETLPVSGPAVTTTLPLRFDIHIDAPGTLRIENNLARMTATADLRLQGTYDRPQLFGRADIDRGDVLFEGNRYQISGTMDFSNAARIEPYVDLEAETRIRVRDQTYRIILGFSGTTSNISMNLNSDPPLPLANAVQLVLGDTRDIENADFRSQDPRTAARAETDLLRALGSRVLASPISTPVTDILEKLGGFDTVQITPSIGSDTDPLAPSARLVIGKRISNRAYLTFIRALGGGTVVREQTIVLEYDQSDRVGFILTQTGDRSFAVDFRVRRRF
jgi:autotransporter translocation and assembly factor TamB